MTDPRTPRPMPSRSIREPGAAPRAARPAPAYAPLPASVTRHAPEPRGVRPRPNPNPLRLMLGLAGLASAAAFTTAMIPSVTPQPDAPATDPAAAVAQPEPSVKHVTRYVTLKPGQTAPPQSTVVVRPNPTPRVTVRVVTRTRQSGKP